MDMICLRLLLLLPLLLFGNQKEHLVRRTLSVIQVYPALVCRLMYRSLQILIFQSATGRCRGFSLKHLRHVRPILQTDRRTNTLGTQNSACNHVGMPIQRQRTIAYEHGLGTYSLTFFAQSSGTTLNTCVCIHRAKLLLQLV